jgi:hypothetical protein
MSYRVKKTTIIPGNREEIEIPIKCTDKKSILQK